MEVKDSTKLRRIAKWFDMFDRQGQGDYIENNEVQQDLRRIARNLDKTQNRIKKIRKRLK